MGLFRRKEQRQDDPRQEIERFWAWWSEHRHSVVAAADARDNDRVAELVRPAVTAIDGGLDWELSHGQQARYLLVVSGGGKPELRAVAERWYLAAPEPDADVEYAPARLRDLRVLESTLVVDDFELPLEELVCGTRLDQRRLRLDIVVHHPLFPLLQQESRLRVAFLALDAALGEDDVERWVGAVDVTADAPIDAIAMSALPTVVEQLQPPGGPDGSTGDQRWAVFRGNTIRGPVQATVRRPFARADRPLCDTYLSVTLTYPKNAEGLPADERIMAAILGLQAECVAALGGDGPHVALVGHELAAGRATVHIYVDGLHTDPRQIKQVISGWEHGMARMHTAADPAWRGVGHLLA
jgi:hypothetical protein